MPYIRHHLIIIVSLLLTLTASAQKNTTRSFNQRLFDAKVAQIEKSLNMSEEKTALFIPIYKEYTEEMIKAWNELVTSSKGETRSSSFRSSRQKRSRQIREEYTDKFATILTEAEIAKFFKVEKEIQRRLREKKERAQNTER